MGGFLQELAKKLAERWVGLLLLPGALFLAVAWAGHRLGHSAALDHAALHQAASDLTDTLARRPAATQAILVVAILLGSTGVGLAVQSLAGVTLGLWLGTWPRPLAPLRRRLVRARRTRWHRLVDRRRQLERRIPRDTRTPQQQDAVDDAAARVNRMALAEPGRPTWMGDRVHAVEQVARDRNGLDLTYAWPRLWLVLPDTARTEITAANATFTSAVTTGTWAWPYLALAAVWWPAVLVAAAIAVTGWTRARTAITDLTHLVEATLDVHARALATALGVSDETITGPLSVAEGRQVTALVRKGR